MDESYEIRGVFLDISKAFDKICHKGLVFELKHNGISGKFLNSLEDFQGYRKQRVILNGQISNCENIQAGPQGSILAPLLIYINDSAENLSSDLKPFADNTFLIFVFCFGNLNTCLI